MEEEIEVWKDCGESKTRFYEVSNLGRVKSITKVNKKEKSLKGRITKHGYLRVVISKKPKFIHTLVALAFIGERPEGLYIDHMDRCKTNNKINNLRYCTRSENQQNRDDYRVDILEQGVERRKVIFKEHYEANREKILEKQKEKYTCECGSIIRKNGKSRHEKSKTHKTYLENLNK